MKIARTVVTTALLLSLLAPTVNAEGDVFIDAERAIVNTPQAIINVSDTIVINGHVYVNGTILRSINNQEPEAYFRPKFAEVKFIKDLVMTAKGHEKGIVYTGQFDLDPVPQRFNEVNRREYELLGRDIILQSETYNGFAYNSVEMPREAINRSNSIMALYKAIGESKYGVQLYRENAPENVSINNSPLLDELKTPA